MGVAASSPRRGLRAGARSLPSSPKHPCCQFRPACDPEFELSNSRSSMKQQLQQQNIPCMGRPGKGRRAVALLGPQETKNLPGSRIRPSQIFPCPEHSHAPHPPLTRLNSRRKPGPARAPQPPTPARSLARAPLTRPHTCTAPGAGRPRHTCPLTPPPPLPISLGPPARSAPRRPAHSPRGAPASAACQPCAWARRQPPAPGRGSRAGQAPPPPLPVTWGSPAPAEGGRCLPARTYRPTPPCPWGGSGPVGPRAIPGLGSLRSGGISAVPASGAVRGCAEFIPVWH